MKQTRIGIIRAAIVMFGGSPDVTYYADNSAGIAGVDAETRAAGDAVYKVEKLSDGLDRVSREQVVEHLNTLPEVKLAYLSRKYNMYSHRGVRYHTAHGHIKVRFYGLA